MRRRGRGFDCRPRPITLSCWTDRNFLGQEPGTDKEIKEFCLLNYDVSFSMFSKISVAGKDIHPLYKFLVNRQGNVVARFKPKQVPEAPEVIAAIEMTLQEK